MSRKLLHLTLMIIKQLNQEELCLVFSLIKGENFDYKGGLTHHNFRIPL